MYAERPSSLLTVAGAVLCAALPLHGQPQGTPSGWSTRVFAGTVFQPETDLDVGGSFDVARLFAGADMSRSLDSTTAISVGFGAAREMYDFSPSVIAWDDVTRLDASFTYSREVAADWTLRVTPQVELAYERGASAGDGLVAGLIVAATHTRSADLRLGLGVAAFTGLEETRAFPFLAIAWDISETWSLGNPFRPGPAGPAGLELVRSADRWEFAVGAAYRSYRFRLDDESMAAEGVAEYNGVPVFARATRELGRGWELDLYAGVVVAGSLEVEDARGRNVRDSDFDAAPLVGLTLGGRF